MEAPNIVTDDVINFSESISRIGRNIESKATDKNQHIKALMQESKRDLIGLMDESYQDAFNIEAQKRKR